VRISWFQRKRIPVIAQEQRTQLHLFLLKKMICHPINCILFEKIKPNSRIIRNLLLLIEYFSISLGLNTSSLLVIYFSFAPISNLSLCVKNSSWCWIWGEHHCCHCFPLMQQDGPLALSQAARWGRRPLGWQSSKGNPWWPCLAGAWGATSGFAPQPPLQVLLPGCSTNLGSLLKGKMGSLACATMATEPLLGSPAPPQAAAWAGLRRQAPTAPWPMSL